MANFMTGLQMEHEKNIKKQQSKVPQWIQEGLELDRLLEESGDLPRFFHALECALEKVSKSAYDSGVISKGRLNDIRYELLGLKPL